MTTAIRSHASQSRRPGVQKRRHSAAQRVADLRTLRRDFGLSQSLAARLLDVSLRTISGLESGTVEASLVRRNVTQMNRLCSALAQAMEPVHIGPWLDEPNEMLAGLKPVEAIERGQLDLVWQVVEGLRSGSQL